MYEIRADARNHLRQYWPAAERSTIEYLYAEMGEEIPYALCRHHRPEIEAQALQAEAPDGGYAFFDGLHKSCSKCKQARTYAWHDVRGLTLCSVATHCFL